MNIKELDLKTLKAMAYDEGVKFEQARANIQIINSEIAERIKQANAPVDESAKVSEPEKKEDKK